MATRPQRPIVVFGSVNRDLHMASERLAGPGETVGSAELTARWGGKGGNQAVAAARLGAQVHLVSAVGDDEAGADAIRALAADGVDCGHVRRAAGVPTGTAVVLVDGAGRNSITVAPRANGTVGVGDLRPALDQLPPGILVTCFELPPAVVRAGVELACAAGWQAVVNPAPPLAPLDGQWPPGVIFTPNEHELRALTGLGDAGKAARRLASQTAGSVVATLGEHGALFVTSCETGHVAAPAAAAVDTTGAGDTFNGALASRLALGDTLVAAVPFAVAAASLSTEREGAREGMPTSEEVHSGRLKTGRSPAGV
jgi:ribokinase